MRYPWDATMQLGVVLVPFFFSEHKSRKGCSVKQHIDTCNVSLCEKDVIILSYNNREDHLLTLEAILQIEIRPKINGKEEFKRKTLSVIFLKNASNFMCMNVIQSVILCAKTDPQ